MKTFQTKTATWVLKDGKWTVTQYKGSQIQGSIVLLPEDIAKIIEELAKKETK